jgi:hypothetical protein
MNRIRCKRCLDAVAPQIAQMCEDFGGPDSLAAETHLTERQVRLALAYRDAYPDEVGDAIADTRRSAAELETLYPFIRPASGHP